MLELKPEHTIANDEATSAAGALKERLDLLCELDLENGRLREAVERARDALSATLQPLLQSRQREGELPATGERERAQLGALGLRVKTLFTPDTEAHVIARSLVEYCEDLLRKIDAAQAFAGESAGLDQAMEALQTAAQQARRDFRALA